MSKILRGVFNAVLCLLATTAMASPPEVWSRLRQFAESGDAKAQYELALRYGEGDGVARDQQLAADWLQRSAENGYAQAQGALGLLMVDEERDAAAREAGMRWLRLAAEQGHGTANAQLGMFAVEAKDPTNALRWFRAAAKAGDFGFQYALGLMLVEGEQIPGDVVEAVQWFRAAAEQDLAAAQFQLGISYRDGRGVKRDQAQAYFWFLLSTPDVAIAQAQVEALAVQLDATARDAAQARVARWRSAHPREVPATSPPADSGNAASKPASVANWSAPSPSAGASGFIELKLWDMPDDNETTKATARVERWEMRDAVAYRRRDAPVDGGKERLILDISRHPIAHAEVATRLDDGDPLPSHYGLSLQLDEDGRPLSGLFLHEQGVQEVLISAMESSLSIGTDTVTGTLRVTDASPGFDEHGYRLDINVHAPLIKFAKDQ